MQLPCRAVQHRAIWNVTNPRIARYKSGLNIVQALLSTIGEIKQPNSNLYRIVSNLPAITDEFMEQIEAQINNNEPSCSLAEVLKRQDLFINSALVNIGASLLWKLFCEGMTTQKGGGQSYQFQIRTILVG